MELKGKTLVFLGSSVTYGSASGGWSMCDYLRENVSVNDMVFIMGAGDIINIGNELTKNGK